MLTSGYASVQEVLITLSKTHIWLSLWESCKVQETIHCDVTLHCQDADLQLGRPATSWWKISSWKVYIYLMQYKTAESVWCLGVQSQTYLHTQAAFFFFGPGCRVAWFPVLGARLEAWMAYWTVVIAAFLKISLRWHYYWELVRMEHRYPSGTVNLLCIVSSSCSLDSAEIFVVSSSWTFTLWSRWYFYIMSD